MRSFAVKAGGLGSALNWDVEIGPHILVVVR